MLCLSFLLLTRLYFLISGQMTVTDDFGYYQASMIQTGETAPVLTSGAALAYSGSLSAILKFTGNRMDMIAYYHIFLQAFSVCFLYLGHRSFFGKAASCLLMLLFSFSPRFTAGIFEISPENYYLCLWSFLYMILGLLSAGKAGIIGILLSLPAWAWLGVVLGGWSFLIKYGNMSENSFWDTIAFWNRGLLCFENGRWQDMGLWLPLWLSGSVLAGVFLKAAASVFHKRKEKKSLSLSEPAKEADRTGEEENTWRIEKEMSNSTDGEKKINYIENPLPLPKKHVKRTMEFKLDEKDDFDIEIDEKDDFDI